MRASGGSEDPRPAHAAWRMAGACIAVVLALAGFGLPPSALEDTVDDTSRAMAASVLRVIVREAHPASSTAESLVRQLDGRVLRPLPIVDGFSAEVPRGAVRTLRASPAVVAAWPDGAVHMTSGFGASSSGSDDEDDGLDPEDYDGWDPNAVWARSIRRHRVTAFDGSGVGVAIVDTGVADVDDLEAAVVARVDLTPEANGVDGYGHGTHLAGIIAGDGDASDGAWRGVAPGADLVSVKVATWNGATDVSAVLAGIQWVVTNRERFGIKVLNLAFGTDSSQSYLVDPLDYAVEKAWKAGILVVAAAGNRGPAPGTVNKPGDDPFVLTVGAVDVKATAGNTDDAVVDFSSRGPTPDGVSKPDVFAPGITLVAPRAPGSVAEAFHPLAHVGEEYIKGSGTSQAAALLSGVAALMFQADPRLTPDLAKAVLSRAAIRPIAGSGGPGLVNALAAVNRAVKRRYPPPANQGLTPSSGLGSLEASRGSLHVVADPDGDGVPQSITGEIDVLGGPWDAKSWSAKSWSTDVWLSTMWSQLAWESSGGDLVPNRGSWTGMGWDAKSWSAKSWSEAGWDAKSWSAKSWSGRLWS